HDLRSPFNAILGFSQLLIEKLPTNDDAETGKYLEHIHSSAQNTLVLLDNLLNWARSQTGRSICNPEKANLMDIVDEIFTMSSASSNVKNIALNYTPTIDVDLYTDVDMLKTILRNLISNAIKYTHTNGEITISALQRQNDIEITVSDNGVGMSDELRNNLFEIETNITTVGTANEKGSGLGLVLCKEFVEKLGGNIWGESEEGNGSDFKFTLPLDINRMKS
nr:HAMP domain-containing sensor histidine kinase [Bacteroidales bacterium]